MRRLFLAMIAAVIAAPLASHAAAQQATLTLEEALELAKRNNPQYLQAVNGRQNSVMGIRSAYAALFPTVSSNMGFDWREGRQEYFAGQPIGATADQLGSRYSVSIGAGYSLASILAPRRAKAELQADDFGITAQEQSLRLAVTQQYFVTVEAGRSADLADTLVASQQLQVLLAQSRERVGSGTPLETKNAEVSLGRQRIAALRARNNEQIQKIRLFEQVGIAPRTDVRLTTELPIVEPTFRAEDLVSQARQANPALAGAQARQHSAEIGRSQARSRYYPSLGISLPGFSGSTSMATDATGAERTWPFNFSRNPFGAGVSFSLTIWDAFGREASNEAAEVALGNARHDVRRTELQLANNVASSLLELQLAWQAIGLENQNAQTAREALALAQERYRVGATSYLELQTAQDSYRSAENSRLSAIYGYHRAFAALEAAVGRSLR
jgi:outer membrane protein